jgi:TatD DNase family protein
MPKLIDTHCHIHSKEYDFEREIFYKNAIKAGVTKMICVGINPEDSQDAIDFAGKHEGAWASVSLIPHEAKKGQKALAKLEPLLDMPKVVAIGECGLDYCYMGSSRISQIEALHFQLDLAIKHNLPLIFHVRDAYDDFWPIFDEHKGAKGVLHSFAGDQKTMQKAVGRGLFMGLNGIVTFSKNQQQINTFKNIPLDYLLLETDAPYLTPKPFRGKVNEPMHVRLVAKFLADLRQESLELVAKNSSSNACKLFKI